MTRNLAYSTISAGSAALMLLLLTVAGRLLGIDGFGAFSYAITVATIAEVVMDFGLHQVAIRAIARDHGSAGRWLATSLVLKILPGLVMVGAFGAGVWLLRDEMPVRLASLLMLLSAAMRSYLLTARGIFQGLERFGDDALVTVGDRLLVVVTCTTALALGADVIGVSIVFCLARVVSAAGAVGLARARAGAGGVDPRLMRTAVGEALPVGLFLLVLNLYNRIDTLMLGSLAGDEATGYYGAAYALYEGLTYGTAVVSAVLAPRFSRLWTADRPGFDRLATRSMAGMAVLSVAVALAGSALAGVGVGLLFGSSYAPAALTLRLLVLGLPFIYVIWVLHTMAVASHRTGMLVRVTGVGIGINVGMNAWLIPAYAANGAAISTAASELVVMLLLFWRLRR